MPLTDRKAGTIMQVALPDIGKVAIIPEYFPTVMQAFIFRNWEMVSKEKIAQVLGTTTENVVKEAERMGLGPQGDTDIWAEKGYITIIRANWHILPYEQLTELLGWSDEKLAYILKEEDFLDIKLGMEKPKCDKVLYRELTKEEIEKTKLVADAVKAIEIPGGAKKPFDFWSEQEEKLPLGEPLENQIVLDGNWIIENATGDEIVARMATRFKNDVKTAWDIDLKGNSRKIVLSYAENEKEEYHKIIIGKDKIEICAGASAGILRAFYRLLDWMSEAKGPYLTEGEYERKPRFGARYIYSFCALYEGALDVDSSTYCPDSLLEKYAKVGVSGIWIQAVLYRVTEFPFDKKMSDGWQMRQENLRNFVNRAKEFGIKIYLYINEPRTMPISFFDKYPEMKGAVVGKYASMCFSSEKARNYLSGAVESLCRAVPGIGGFFTITMSENFTHCKSRERDIECPHCKDKDPWELAAQANRLIAEGAHRADPNVLVIAWDWAWSKERGFNDGDQAKCMQALPKSVAVMSKRETEIPFVRGGVNGSVSDYAISVEGLSPISCERWKMAKDAGLETVVKLQINNSWECSTVPYLPVYGMLTKQMDSLIEIEMNHLMLGWTLGGYPSPSIKLISEAFFEENGKAPDYDKSFRIIYGDNAEKVKKATDIFCDAFRQFPFHVDVLYFGPQNAGVSNPLYSQPTGYEATMTCYAYDDLEKWSAIYPVDVFENQFKLVSDKWEEGLRVLGDGKSEINDMSYVGYSLFKSSYNQIRFIRLRSEYEKNKADDIKTELKNIVKSEKEIAQKIYEIMCRRPSVGFEAANHYYFNRQMIMEKIINCDYLLDLYAL